MSDDTQAPVVASCHRRSLHVRRGLMTLFVSCSTAGGRRVQIGSLDEVAYAVLETNGRISFLTR